jgi:hypothetical protein
LNPVSGKFVVFDDCRLLDGTMIDAKGTGYLQQLSYGEERYPWLGIQEKMLKRARSQLEAAQGRPIEWHFAEQAVADYVQGIFDYSGITIRIIHTPWRR